MASGSSARLDESAPVITNDEILQQFLHDDQEEWEYEYSTTETETYYLTLELSYPEFKGTSTRTTNSSRVGYNKNWQEIPGGPDPTTRPSAGAAANARGKEDEDDASNDDEEAVAAEQDEGEDGDGAGDIIDPALGSKGKEPMRANIGISTNEQNEGPTSAPGPGNGAPGQEGENTRDEIQILDLHSENPLISYRGRLFEGEWAEIIGTETLFTRHDEKNPLPSLRQVPGNIDLLGALSSRIVTKEKIATARRQDEDPLAATRADWKIHIPVTGKDPKGERQQQARFLENLIALKKMKGQTDDVTVYARDGAGKDFDDKKGPDYKPRRRKGGPAAATASATPSEAGESSRRGVRARIGRAPGRGRAAAVRRGKQRAVMSQPRSTPTPARWEDLDEGDEGEAMDEDDDSDDDDVSMGL